MLYLASNPILQAYQGSDLFGKGIFLALFFLSVVTWTLFFKKFLRQRAFQGEGERLLNLIEKRRMNPLSLEPGEKEHPFAALSRALKRHTLELLQKNKAACHKKEAVALSHSDIDLIKAHLMTCASAESKALEKHLFILSTIVSLAPFLGLLGTVWGILLTFGELQGGGSVNTNATIMGGLAMALGTTVLGLLVAIPALISYNYLKASVASLSGEMEDFANLLVASVELHYRQVEVKV